MNVKRLLLAAGAVYVCYEILNLLIHMVVMGPQYMEMKDVWRTNMMDIMWVMYITNFIMSFFFVYIFAKGYEDKGLGEGLRYGLIMAGFTAPAASMSQYVLYNVPLAVALQWIVYQGLQITVCGLVASLVYKKN